MSTYTFSDEEFDKLSKNPYVLRCSHRVIIYTHEFKKHALELRSQGVSSRDIWRRSGFDIDMWKEDYARTCLKNWRRIVKEKGYEGLSKLRSSRSSGRPKTKGITEQDKIKRLELQVRYLKAENDFLAKLRAKRAESNSGQNRNTK